MNMLKFIGTNGSLGLEHGKTYKIYGININKHVTLKVDRGDGTIVIPYKDLSTLGKNWEFIRKE